MRRRVEGQKKRRTGEDAKEENLRGWWRGGKGEGIRKENEEEEKEKKRVNSYGK